MRRLRLLLAIVASAAAACADDLSPRSLLVDLRVLALVATPLECGPDEAVTVRPHVVPPPGVAVVDERWSFCPLTTGASGGHRCVVAECEVPLTPLAGSAPGAATVSASPGALARECLARLTVGTGPVAPPAELPDPVPTVFRYVVTASDGERREAIQIVPLHVREAPTDRNAPPAVRSVSIGGRPMTPGVSAPPLAPGASLEVRVILDPASAQPYVDAAGVSLVESLVVSFYTTAGRFDFDRANGPDAAAVLKHEEVEPGTVTAQVWAVARDLRGGETVVGPFAVPVQASP
jgi:hypothetical protein